MLTFEEFFKKKKIDLQHLQQAEPLLFAEFSREYPLMGEKSFDYTKKYWFNNLRHLYPLPQAPKPHQVQADAISQMAVQGVAVAAAQNLDPGIERPKFTEDNLPELVAKNVPEQDISLVAIEKMIIEDKPETELSTESPLPETEPAKPAFKPRFKMQNIKKEVVKTVSETEPEKPVSEPATENPQPKTEEAKPAYKPRFQMKNIQKPATENPPPATEN